MLFFSPQPAVCFLPASQASSHTHTHFLTDTSLWWFVRHPSPSVIFSQQQGDFFYTLCCVLKTEGWYLNLCGALFFFFSSEKIWAKKCITVTNDKSVEHQSTRPHTCRGAGDVLDSRMCLGNFTGFSHAFRIAPQPFSFLHRSGVRLCLCVYPGLCLSILAHIQNSKGKNKEAGVFLRLLHGLNF